MGTAKKTCCTDEIDQQQEKRSVNSNNKTQGQCGSAQAQLLYPPQIGPIYFIIHNKP